MKPLHDPRHSLLEDVFEPAATPRSPSVDVVIGAVRKAKRAQSRSKTGGVILAILTGAFVWNAGRPAPEVQVISKPTTTINAPRIETTPTVERLDDEGVATLLDSTPSAVVEWPDGRRTLLLLVSSTPTAKVTR